MHCAESLARTPSSAHECQCDFPNALRRMADVSDEGRSIVPARESSGLCKRKKRRSRALTIHGVDILPSKQQVLQAVFVTAERRRLSVDCPQKVFRLATHGMPGPQSWAKRARRASGIRVNRDASGLVNC